jgi:MFS family permease
MTPLVVLFTASVLTGVIYRGFLTFLPAYMDQRVTIGLLGIDPLAVARSSTTIALVLGILGQYASGAVAAGRRLQPLALAVSAALVPLLLLMGFTENLVLVPLVCLFVLVNSMMGPIFNSLVTDYSPAALRGRIFGGYFFFSLGLGSFGAGLAGLLAENYGLEWVFPGMGVVALVLTVLVTSLLMAPAPRFATVAR